MARNHRVRAAATGACVGFLVFTGASARLAAAAGDPVAKVLGYIASQQSPADGSILSDGKSFAPSELYAIAGAVAGHDPTTLRRANGPSVMDYLKANVIPASADAGKCAELIQTVVAAGLNPRSFAGHDLVAALNAYYDPATGKFGNGQAFTQALAIQALVAAAASAPPAAVTFVEQARDSDGGWDYLNVKDDTNPNDFATSDTNSTAMALMALHAAGVRTIDSSTRQWLHSQQNPDGGFPYQATSNPATPSDPDSTALVVQAIAALGDDPAGSAWAMSGNTPIAELIATQDASGGYAIPGKTQPDTFTTSQVPLGLERRPFPVAVFGAAQAGTPGAHSTPQPSSGLPVALVVLLILIPGVIVVGGTVVLIRGRGRA